MKYKKFKFQNFPKTKVTSSNCSTKPKPKQNPKDFIYHHE